MFYISVPGIIATWKMAVLLPNYISCMAHFKKFSILFRF